MRQRKSSDRSQKCGRICKCGTANRQHATEGEWKGKVIRLKHWRYLIADHPNNLRECVDEPELDGECEGGENTTTINQWGTHCDQIGDVQVELEKGDLSAEGGPVGIGPGELVVEQFTEGEQIERTADEKAQ